MARSASNCPLSRFLDPFDFGRTGRGLRDMKLVDTFWYNFLYLNEKKDVRIPQIKDMEGDRIGRWSFGSCKLRERTFCMTGDNVH